MQTLLVLLRSTLPPLRLGWYMTSGTTRMSMSVEQVVVYSTTTTGVLYSYLWGEVVANGSGVEERSEVIYCIEGDMVIYYRIHNGHSCIV